ncbi:MAG: sulfatase [Candidatus Sumerlaeota bacterium]
MATPPPEKRVSEDRPNILYIFTDQQHWRMMSCAGNQHLHTPAMDSLAENGVRFNRAYCANPVCVPSRMSMATGLMPSQMGMIGNPSHDCVITDEMRRNGLGWLMQYAGYDVAYGGKTHLGQGLSLESLGYHNYISRDERDELATAAADFIKQDRDKPFFLVASFINPHDICYMGIRDHAVTDFERRIAEKGVTEQAELDKALERPDGMSDEEFFEKICPPLPENYQPDPNEPEAIRYYMEDRPFMAWIRENWDDEKWRLHRYAYARLTERVDGQIARVLDALHESGQEENTVIIFSSDHGDNDASRKAEHKSLPYDESIRVPFIVSQKGTTKVAVDESHLVCNGLDLMPTVCDYAEIEAPSTCRGRSVRPLVEGRETDWRDHLVVETEVSRTIFQGPWQYITFAQGENQEQLFNLEEDPHAIHNLIDAPQFQDKVEELRAKLAADIEEIDDEVGRKMLERSPEWKRLPLGTAH